MRPRSTPKASSSTLTIGRKHAVGGVVLEEVGVGGRRDQVVHGHDLEIGPGLAGRPEEVPADSPEPVDPYAYRHRWRLLICLIGLVDWSFLCKPLCEGPC